MSFADRSYGQIYVEAGSTAQALNATPGTFDKLTGFAAAVSAPYGTVPSHSSDNVPTTNAMATPWIVSYSLSFKVSAAGLYRFAPFADGVALVGAEGRIDIAMPSGLATGTITCATKANLADTDYITIGDGLTPAKLYEFDTAGDGVTAGRVQVNVSADTTAATVAARLRTAILANQPALSVTDNADGTLTVTHKWPGSAGAVTITENVAHASFTVSGLTAPLLTHHIAGAVHYSGGGNPTFDLRAASDQISPDITVTYGRLACFQ